MIYVIENRGTKQVIMYRYIGNKSFIVGLPARDLTDEESRKSGAKIKRAVEQGLYIKVREQRKEKPVNEGD